MANIEGELNDIKRSSDNDGLVAVSSQFIPRTFTNPNTRVTRINLNNPVLGNIGDLGYIRMPNEHHNSIKESRTVMSTANAMINDARRIRGR